jgi:hypothetical protein
VMKICYQKVQIGETKFLLQSGAKRRTEVGGGSTNTPMPPSNLRKRKALTKG